MPKQKNPKKMKHGFTNLTLIFLFQMVLGSCVFSQCITGDCENGTGTYISADKTRAEGSWRNGNLNGKCKIFYKSGATYDGDMVDGKKYGFGKYVYSNGNYYEGSYKANKQHGSGKFFSVNCQHNLD